VAVGDDDRAAAVTRQELDELHGQVAALRAEVDELRSQVERGAAPPRYVPGAGPSSDDEVFWALQGLQARSDDPAGAVLFTGSVTTPPGGHYLWQQGASVGDLLEADWSELAPSLDALAHPVRLQLLQLVLGGTDRTADLQDAHGLGTSGQLHHHLRQLVAGGWLRSTGRGRYEIPAGRVVPLLVLLVAADR
jgi:hypothetical protein